MKVGVLLLAAGRSRRFGSDKRLARLNDGHTLLQRSVASINETGLPLVVCLSDADDGTQLLDGDAPVHYCTRADAGMGATIAEGIALANDWHGVMIALADMPFIRRDTYLAVARHLDEHRIVLPTCAGQAGHPVGFGRDFFAELAQLGGDRGARAVIDRHRQSAVEITVDDPGIHRDIDRPDDLADVR